MSLAVASSDDQPMSLCTASSVVYTRTPASHCQTSSGLLATDDRLRTALPNTSPGTATSFQSALTALQQRNTRSARDVGFAGFVTAFFHGLISYSCRLSA